MALDDEVIAKRDEAISWLTATLSLLVQRNEADAAGNETEAKFFAQAAAAAVVSLNLTNAHVALSVVLEALLTVYEERGVSL